MVRENALKAKRETRGKSNPTPPHRVTPPPHTANKMKSASCIAFIASAMIAAAPATTTAVDFEHSVVATCHDLAALSKGAVSTGVLTINSTAFDCDDYTTFNVVNDMTLDASGPVEFNNFALKVLEGINLTIGPDVSFGGVDKQVRGSGDISVRVT